MKPTRDAQPALRIRPEEPGDRERVLAALAAAFDRPLEAELVEALRASASPHLSLVAELDGDLVGHVFFSPVAVEGAAGAPPCAGLSREFDHAFQVLELEAGAQDGCRGFVRYHAAFASVPG